MRRIWDHFSVHMLDIEQVASSSASWRLYQMVHCIYTEMTSIWLPPS
jgi:hypothetical protein